MVIALVALGWSLRSGALGPSSLWLDDAWVALVHRTEGLDELRRVGFAAPGFAALLRGWFALVGFDELRAQLPALLAGVATPPALYLLARRLRWHPAAGLLGAAALVASPIAIMYATRVKQYTLEGLLGVLLLALALWLLGDVRDDRRWAVFVGAGVLATGTSAFLAPTVAAGVAAAAVRVLEQRRDRAGLLRVVGWGGGYALVALAWYLGVLRQGVTGAIAGFWGDGFLVVDDGAAALAASLGSVLEGLLEGLTVVPPAWAAVAVVVAVVVVGVERPERAVLLVTPTLVAVGLAALQLAPLGGGRTDLYLYPSLALLVTGGVSGVLRRLERASWSGARVVAGLAVVAVVLGAVGLVLRAEPVTSYPRFDVRPLAQQIDAVRADDEVLLLYPATIWAYALYTEGGWRLVDDPVSSWGFSPRFDDPQVVPLPPGRDNPGAYLPTVTALGEGEAEVVWLLASHWREDLDALREQLADAGFSRGDREARDGAVLERWERLPLPS